VIIRNYEINAEFNRINGFVLEELEKDIPDEILVDNLNEYLQYLDERYKHGESANRPNWVTEYVNLPSEERIW